MEQQYSKVLLVHNRFDIKQPVTWLSFIIRVVTCSKWNHAAILTGDDEVVEAVGKGIISTPYALWANNGNRIVRVMNPLVPLNLEVQSGPYGFLDLVQVLKHLIKTRWLGKPEKWDGIKGTRLWKGAFCSELVAIALGLKDAHLVVPADLLHVKELAFEREFETHKI